MFAWLVHSLLAIKPRGKCELVRAHTVQTFGHYMYIYYSITFRKTRRKLYFSILQLKRKKLSSKLKKCYHETLYPLLFTHLKMHKKKFDWRIESFFLWIFGVHIYLMPPTFNIIRFSPSMLHATVVVTAAACPSSISVWPVLHYGLCDVFRFFTLTIIQLYKLFAINLIKYIFYCDFISSNISMRHTMRCEYSTEKHF